MIIVFSSQNEQCFYDCEPMLDYFQVRDTPGILNVPVCASYCDDWFDACRNDLTCVENWLATVDRGVPNSCPPDSPCITFEAMFQNGKGICDKMWKPAIIYSEDVDNCTVMQFDANMPNPNFQLSFGGEKALQSSILIVGIVALALVSMV